MFIPLDERKQTLCSAGLNYFVVKANGDVNRCFCDISSLGDMLDPKLFEQAMPCNARQICDTSADQMFSTQWPLKKNSINPIATNWKESENPEEIVRDHALVVIYPTERCNFNCQTCCNYYPDGTNKRPEIPERPLEDWLGFLELLSKRFKSVQININGGEPLVRSDLEQIITKALELNFDCSMVTNFSIPKQLDKILLGDNRLSLSITLHPVNQAYHFPEILKYILLFKEKGFKLRTTLLGSPDNRRYYEPYKGLFQELGIPFWLKWCGGYEYPKEFKDFLVKNGAHRSTPEYLKEIGWYKHVIKTSFLDVQSFNREITQCVREEHDDVWQMLILPEDKNFQFLSAIGCLLLLDQYRVENKILLEKKYQNRLSYYQEILDSLGINKKIELL